MFMNVITGYFSTFKIIQGHSFRSRSCQGQINSPKCVFCYIPYIYSKYKKDKPNSY